MSRFWKKQSDLLITKFLTIGSRAKLRVASSISGVYSTILNGTLIGLSTGAALNLTGSGVTTTLTQEDANRPIILNDTGSGVVVLPAATGSGLSYRFIVGSGGAGTSSVIEVASASDIMQGCAYVAIDSGNTVLAFETAADSDTVTLNGTTTGGEVAGEEVVLTDIEVGLFAVMVHSTATGSEATPFSADVS